MTSTLIPHSTLPSPPHMIGWYKVVQDHGKQCSLITSLALDITHKKTSVWHGHLLIDLCLKDHRSYRHETFF